MDTLQTVVLPMFLLGLLTVLIVFGNSYLSFLKKQAEAKLGAENWEQLWSAARTFIMAAEQVAGLDTNEKKKQFVVQKLTDFADDYGMVVNGDMLDALIEGVLRNVKHGNTELTAELDTTNFLGWSELINAIRLMVLGVGHLAVEGAEKKHRVLDKAVGLAQRWGYPISEPELDLIIEGVYQETKVPRGESHRNKMDNTTLYTV